MRRSEVRSQIWAGLASSSGSLQAEWPWTCPFTPQQWDLVSAPPAQGLRVDLLSIHSRGQYVRRVRLPYSITLLSLTQGLLAQPQVQYFL